MDSEKFGGLKKFLVGKKFWAQKIVGPKKFWVKEKFGVLKKIQSAKNFGSKKSFNPKKFYPTNFGSIKILGPKKFRVKKNLRIQIILTPVTPVSWLL